MERLGGGGVLSFILPLGRHARRLCGAPRASSGEAPHCEQRFGVTLSRTHQPLALATAGAVQPLAGEKQGPAVIAPPAPLRGCGDIGLGRSAGGLEKEGTEASHRAVEVRDSSPLSRFFPGMRAGVARLSPAQNLLPELAFASPSAWQGLRTATRESRAGGRRGGAGLAPLTLQDPRASSLFQRTCPRLRHSALQRAWACLAGRRP